MVPYAAVLIDRGGQLLLGRQYGGYPCPPGGRIEAGESPREAAAREVLEEAGLTVRPGDLAEVRQVIHAGKNRVPHRGWWYAARVWQGEPVNLEPSKCEGWVWYRFDALPDGMDHHTAAAVAAYIARSRP